MAHTPKTDTHFVSLIVPAYKQEQTIIKDIARLKQTLDLVRYDYEIIVVVDGVVDKTYELLKKKKIPKTVCLMYEKNHGKSFAIRVGMSQAKGDYIMFIDSGMEIDPNGISMLLEHMEWYGADIIVGSKRHPASHVKYTWQRRLLSLGYYLLVSLFFGVPVKDTQAGIKVFRRDVLKRVLPRLMEKRFAGDLELLVVARHLGYKRIYEAPIKLDYELSALSSASTLHSITQILIDTLAIFYRLRLTGTYEQANTHTSLAGVTVYKHVYK